MTLPMNSKSQSIQPHILFISDLHLEKERPDITTAFLNFLSNEAKQAQALYILGDFFEAWIGDDDDNDFHRQIITALHESTQAGLPIYLMHGNRDFLIGKQFAKACGITLIKDPTVIELSGERILLMHGDSLCTLDRGHQFFRMISQNYFIKTLFLMIPLKLRKYIARLLRSKSTLRTQQLDSYTMDVTTESVLSMMKKNKVRKLIHGHTHQPATHQLQVDDQPGQRIVLASWHDGASWLTINI